MNHPPQIFIIYSAESDHHKDRVLALSDKLRQEGVNSHLDQYETSPPQGWARWRREQIEQADYILVVCTEAFNRRVTGEGPAGLEKAVAWESTLIEDAIYQTAAQNRKVIPVLFSPEDQPHIPTFLGTVSFYVLDTTGYLKLYRHLTNQPETIKPELGILKSLPPKSKAALPPNPYRGLEVFRKEHKENFFGRTTEIAELKQLVEQQRLVAVIGASGSGKSSLVLAGLVPALEATGKWVISEGRPKNQPFEGLAAAFVSWLYPDPLDHLEKTKEFAQKLNTGGIALPELVRYLQAKFPQQRFLLIIDQFEEIFTLTTDIPLQQRFLDRLLEGVQAELPLTLLCTLRADFMGQVLAYAPLATALDRHAKKLLSAMETDGLRAAIEEPAKRLDVSLETGLTQRILDDVGKEPGNLPLLEFALTELWEKQQYGDLTHAAYEEIGGVQLALARYADEVYKKFDVTTQAQVRQVFMRLVHPGEGTGDTRQMATRDEVRDWESVRKLADARLVVTGQDENTHQDTVEVVHEALIRHWQPLRKWVEEDRKFLVWLHDLRHKEQEWRGRQPQDDGLLLRGFKLREAQEKLKKYGESISDGEKAFIEASVALREKEAQEREQQAQLLHEQRNRALISQSLILSYIAGQHVENHPFTAIRLAFESLPNLSESFRERPEVKEVYPVLLNAINQYRLGIIEHDDGVDFSEFSPDGNFLLSYGGNTAYIWSFPDFYLHATLLGHKDKIWSATFSSDSRLIVTTSDDKTAILWEVATGKQVFILQGHTERVRSAAFSHDNKYVVTASFDSSVRLWETETGQQIAILQENIGRIWSATFTPDNKHILISSDKCVLRWEIGDQSKHIVIVDDKMGFNVFSKLIFGKSVRYLVKSSGMLVSAVSLVNYKEIVTITSYCDMSISSNSIAIGLTNPLLVATSSNKHTVHVWNIETTKLVFTAQTHDKQINSIVFDKDDRFILTASEDKKAILWNIQEGKQHAILEGHTSGVNSAYFSPDSKYVVTASKDRTIRLWHVDTGKAISIYKTDKFGLDSCVAFSPDGGYLTTQSGNDIYLWQVEDDKLRETSITFSGHKETVNAIAFSPNNKYLASASKDGTAIVWDRTTRKIVNLLKQHKDEVLFVAFSRDNKWLVTTSKDKTACVWKTDTGELVKILRGHTDEIKSASFDIHSNYVFTVSKDKTIRVWEVQTGLLIHKLTEHTDGINSIALSSNGKYIATASADKTCIIWETSTRTMVQKLLGHTGTINTVIFHPNDETVITGADANDSTVRLWEITTGKQLFELHAGHFVRSISLSPDKKYIAVAVGLWNGNVRLWRIFEHVEEMIAYAKKILPPSDRRPNPMLLTCEERKRFFLEELERCK